jgi:ArsR family transcriptional regulator
LRPASADGSYLNTQSSAETTSGGFSIIDLFQRGSAVLLKEGSMPPRKESRRPDEGNGQNVELPEVSEQAIRELAQVFKLLSDETRLRILFYLALSENRELHVTDLCQRLGQSQPAVSHHLALLRVSGLIESRREGKHNYYSVRTDHFGDLLLSLFSAAGEVPRNKKYKFHDFTLAYTGA